MNKDKVIRAKDRVEQRKFRNVIQQAMESVPARGRSGGGFLVPRNIAEKIIKDSE